ncbi:imidazole glycerol phosphate synthase subunit HisH [Candidatus Poribacteria bacterium]|nr:imidazole glycerol phosphate synthase subunit HisH [Candidatus Poribacteria bacterium]MBT5534088.1 imidazole glycerol phosphate synthase subunit HisH [Candidatus Poribacteria bacterium]MBT5711933.1 imidazole glycerol phosphate synthase subunit HisH [Candidatus Poribacteria bacterium]MBT7099844.1 imidazole glycerol phosphate synthase subunit HisH [Candidatus Poribacteria bacterium]MBT7804461.1 imidazole glycerol phosphate synthase subunit HisH [Candidatus Poribacteria bacterium]
MIAIVDYGMGNLRSVAKALEYVGADPTVTSDPSVVAAADAVVLPGQGAFGAAMQRLNDAGMTDAVKDSISAGKPYLGICLGLQVLFESSEEAPDARGFGLLGGTVDRFEPGLKVPHMGWNQLVHRKQTPQFQSLDAEDYVYFVHSYYVAPSDPEVIAAETDYGVRFTSAIHVDNMCAMQFHPEKSQRVGLGILSAFAEMTR